MKIIHLHDGNVVLYKRANSQVWQVRIKVGSGEKGWKRLSTGESDSNAAERFASDKFHEFRVMAKLGLSPDSKTFKHCALVAEKEMRNALSVGKGKIIYEDYIRTLHKYLIPFFGQYIIDTIDYSKIEEFNTFRLERLGRPPARSTVNNHNATLKRVFNVALKNKWMKRESIPTLSNDGVEISDRQIRPYFEDSELKKLFDFLKKWRGTGRSEISRQIRTLLYDYVYIIAFTGIRPGTEADYIRFNDLKEFIDRHGKKVLHIRVSGKTGERILPAGKVVKQAIDRIVSRHHALETDDKEFFEPFEKKDYIFELECTRQLPKDLGRAFKKALQSCGLLYDNYGKVRTLYSLRHTYATSILIKKETNIHLLARHMGTSVAMIERHYSHAISIHKSHRVILTGSFEDILTIKDGSKDIVKMLKQIKPKSK